MHLLNFIYLFLFPFLSVAPEPNLFPSGVDYSDFTASPGLSTGGNGFESIKLEIPSPGADNTAPPDLVDGEGNPSGVQSDPEIVLLAGKPKKEAPTPTPNPTPTTFGPPIRQNPNVPEEAWDAYAGYPQPSDLPDLYIPGTQTFKPQTRGLCLKGKELFCCRWGSHTYLSTGKTTRGPIKCFKFPGQSRITDNPQCIRKQQYCCDSIDNFLNGINCQAAKPGKKVEEPAAAAAADSTPADGPPPPPPLAGNPSEKTENELVAPDPNPFQDSIPPASGGNSWNLLEILPVLTDFWPDWERFPL